MDRSKGYNRRARKLLHIAAGFPALALPYVTAWVALIAALAGVILAHWIRPKHAWWLRYITKPADRNRNIIAGMRSYSMVILLLVLLWFPLERLAGTAAYATGAVRYIMFGWLAMAWGDGLAALMGPGPSVARTVPWNKQKTWWGVLGCFVGTWVAFIACFAWPLRGTESLYLANPLGYGAAVAVVIAIVESLVSKVDDNYIVGLGGAAAAWAVVSLLK
ncbi:hypothetical protein IIA79_06390 [bacterium]|nr:hypothetical protein [bacterium]